MLELKSISKRFGSFTVSDLNLLARDGEYLVLLGPSGVGKTVLLEMVAGLVRPDSGRILWDGLDITSSPPETRRFAMVYQDYALFPHMTARQNIEYGCRSKRSKARISGLARDLGIERLIERYPAKLSGGEQQRVALARSLATDPQLMLLDEPLSALDGKTRRQLRRELKRIHGMTGTTFLHVTHDTEEAMSLGDRVGVMLDGRLRQIGTPEEIFRSPTDPEVADFLGMRNVIAVSDVKDNICGAGGLRIHCAAADESVSHIWIKPEEIILSRDAFDSSARNQFKCRVLDWEHAGPLLAVRVSCGGLTLSALITHASFQHLGVSEGEELYATFKSSAVHCF